MHAIPNLKGVGVSDMRGHSYKKRGGVFEEFPLGLVPTWFECVL